MSLLRRNHKITKPSCDMSRIRSIIVITVITVISICIATATAAETFTVENFNNISFLQFDELKKLSEVEYPDKVSVDKLTKLLNTVILKKNPDKNGVIRLNKEAERKFIRVTQWNIERGFRIDTIKKIFNDADKSNEIEHIKKTDIFTLNEVDIGVSRTGYKNIAREMASMIGSAYVFAPEFIEVDPKLLNDPKVDPQKYRGLHGNAIVSRFPIKSARIIHLPVCYDWFSKERKKLSELEIARRKAAEIAVKEDIITEVRRGNRIALVAEIELPNKDRITVVSTHLENRVEAACRVKQMQAILSEIQNVTTPVVLGGDLNSFENDASPTSIKKVIISKAKDPAFVAKTTFSYLNPYGWIVNLSSLGIGTTRKYKDPTVKHIPILLPNKARKLFAVIESFEFDDGNEFSESDKKQWRYGRSGKWGCSNERFIKGFKQTFRLNRSFKVAEFKIDWLFVKPVKIDHGKRYFPAFGRTLLDLNNSPKDGRISDHNPISVDLIF